MKILFITDEIPIPPLNGVTIPIYHLITGLSKNHEISLLFLNHSPKIIPIRKDIKKLLLLKNFWTINLSSKNILRGILSEIFLIKPFFVSVQKIISQPVTFNNTIFDIIWCSPIRPVARIPEIVPLLSGNKPLLIAGINDFLTDTLKSQKNNIFASDWRLVDRINNLFRYIRSFILPFMECKLLDKADKILLQTDVDTLNLKRQSKGKFKKRIIIFPNGVDDALFDIPYRENGSVLGIIGNLSQPGNQRTVRWLIYKVIPVIKHSIPDLKIHILGKQGPSDIMNLIHDNSLIEYHSEVSNMSDFLSILSVLIVRSYKKNGLINRTVEAMASGVIVIGEEGTFNGINGFQNYFHGISFNKENQVPEILIKIFSDPSLKTSIRENARTIAQKDFNWVDRIRWAENIFNDFYTSNNRESLSKTDCQHDQVVE